MKTRIYLTILLLAAFPCLCIGQVFHRLMEFPDIGSSSFSTATDLNPDGTVIWANGADLDADGSITWGNGADLDADGSITWGNGAGLESDGAIDWDTVPSGSGPSMGGGKGQLKLKDLATDVAVIENAVLEIQEQVADFAIVNTTIIGTLRIFGDDDTASADEIAFTLATTATSTWTDGDEDSRAELSVLNNGVLNNDQLVLATDGTVTTSAAFIPTDLVIPQASPAVPAVDGAVELDFTDGTLVVQHGSAHAELGSATDVVMGKLIDSRGGTIMEPDGINASVTVFPVNSVEFPHGIVITAIYLEIGENTTYVLTVENYDDFDTINGANPTIDTVTYTADASGNITDSTPTYATIAAGQQIRVSLPATDVNWINFRIFFYEPAA